MKNLLFILFCFSGTASAQYAVQPYGDVQGTPLKEVRYTEVSGSAYFFDNWSKGKIITKSGKMYQVDSLKYDLIDDQLVFLGDKGIQMHFAEPVTKFEIENGLGEKSYFVNGLPSAEGLNSNSYLEVIYDGKVALYKRTSKVVVEDKPYGSATVNKSFKLNNSYYTFQDGTLKKISLSSKTVLTLFESKKTEITDYLKNTKVNFKNDQDLKNLFIYFNKL